MGGRKRTSWISPYDLILHFSYHKCLTVYYGRIMNKLAEAFKFERRHFQGNIDGFNDHVANTRQGVFSVNNHDNVSFGTFHENFIGSHFIRNPRDLIISGYKYHLWTDEAWCKNPDFNWSPITSEPLFSSHIASKPEDFPKPGISYQEYLNGLDKERGLILEMLWRKPIHHSMANWDYDNPRILEMRYEEIIGNESIAFQRLFEHYQFHDNVIDKGLQIVAQFSLERVSKKDQPHVRHGGFDQWRSEFTAEHIRIFEKLFPNMMQRLGYDH